MKLKECDFNKQTEFGLKQPNIGILLVNFIKLSSSFKWGIFQMICIFILFIIIEYSINRNNKQSVMFIFVQHTTANQSYNKLMLVWFMDLPLFCVWKFYKLRIKYTSIVVSINQLFIYVENWCLLCPIILFTVKIFKTL